MRICIVLLALVCHFPLTFAQTADSPTGKDSVEIKWFFNEKLVAAENVRLINPMSIEKIDVLKSAGEIRVTTKEITWLGYQDLRKQVPSADENETPDIEIDGKMHEDKLNIQIDKSFMRSIKKVRRGSQYIISIKTGVEGKS